MKEGYSLIYRNVCKTLPCEMEKSTSAAFEMCTHCIMTMIWKILCHMQNSFELRNARCTHPSSKCKNSVTIFHKQIAKLWPGLSKKKLLCLSVLQFMHHLNCNNITTFEIIMYILEWTKRKPLLNHNFW